MNNSQKPLARKDNLVLQEMPEELLVYDLDTNKAHCLNQSAAFVWKSCNGDNNITDITKLFTQKENKQVDENIIWLAIDQLNEKGLFQNEVFISNGGETRRSVIKKIGMAAVIALPVVASLTAPTSVLAATSCLCTTNANCTGQAGCPATCNTGMGVCQQGPIVTPKSEPIPPKTKTKSSW